MMEAWRKIRLGSACETNVDSYSPKEEWTFVNYLDTGNITENRIDSIQYIDVKNEKLPSRARRKVKTDSIIYSTVRPNQCHFGIIKSQPENFLVSTGFAVIEVNAEVLDADFLYYLLTQATLVEALHAIAEQSTSAYPSIKASDIEDLEIEIPDLGTQKKIADVLGSLDRKMAQNTAINKNLEQQAQAYFIDLFVVNADSAWQQGTLSDLGTVVGGGTPSKNHPEYYSEHGIPWITPKDLSVDKSKFISHGENDISELGFSSSSAIKMPEGTVLFSSRAPIGYIAIASNTVTTNQGFKSVIPNNNVGSAFMYFFLKQTLPIIDGMASGSTFKEISGSGMKSVPAVIPDNETLQVFNEFCKPLFEQQAVMEAENRRLSGIRDTLLPKLMSDEIDVSDIDL